MHAPEHITKIVARKGYFTASFDSYDSFARCALEIGHTFQCTRIEQSQTVNGLLASSSSMSLHTDSPDADIIAWYCQSRSDNGGASLLQDFNTVKEILSPSSLNALRQILIKVPGTSRTCSLHSDAGVYFADWLIDAPSRIRFSEAIEELKSKIQNTPTEILLERKDALFIDNKRMLHGRTAFHDGNKPRLLIRHWISLKGLAE